MPQSCAPGSYCRGRLSRWATSRSLPFAERKDCAFFVSFGLFLPQAQLLRELQHRETQEARHRQQMDLMKNSSMEKLLEDMEQKEQHLQLLTEAAERASRLGQLQQKRSQRELQQVTPERGSSHLEASHLGCTSQSWGLLLEFSMPVVSPTFVISRPTRIMEVLLPTLG